MIKDGLDFAPFRGVRYGPDHLGSLATVTSPPYDVVVRPDGLHDLQTADPYNIVRLTLPQAADPATGHRNAARTLNRWLNEGVLVQDPEPAFYVYEQSRGDVLQRGIIGSLRLSPPEHGVVLPHEDVMPAVVAERADLMRETAANLEPLLLCYTSDGSVSGAAAVLENTISDAAPWLATTTDDGFQHRLWGITEPAAQQAVTADLARHTALIGDGHHRWATYLRLAAELGGGAPWDRGLVMLVDTARYPLQVSAIHRALPQLPPTQAVEALEGHFRVSDGGSSVEESLNRLRRTSGNAFVLVGGSPELPQFTLIDHPDPESLSRTLPPNAPEGWRQLDASVLHETLLNAVWSVPDQPASIRYLHDTESAVAQGAKAGGTTVLMRPVTESTVRALAEQGTTMPRKSTSFGPKPATGLVLRKLDAPH